MERNRLQHPGDDRRNPAKAVKKRDENKKSEGELSLIDQKNVKNKKRAS